MLTCSTGLAAIAGASRAYARNQSGAVAIIAAIAFPVLIGGMGLGAEVGYWYLTERKLQHAADVSAFGAAVRLSKGDEDKTLDEIALNIARQSGFDRTKGKIEVHHPPVSGPNAGDEDMVEVVLTEDIDRAFSGFFSGGDVLVRGRAVARITSTPNPACLIALAPSGAQSLSVTGTGGVTLNSCVAVANSTDPQGIFVKGSGSLDAKCAYTASGNGYAQKPSSLVTDCDPEVQKDTVADPYASIVLPTKSATCFTPAKKSDYPIPVSSRKINGVNVYDLCELVIDQNISLSPGIYIVYSGDVTDSGNHTVTGTDVTFYLTSKPSTPTDYARIDLKTASLDLKARTVAPYAGLLFFSDVANTREQSFGGNSELQAQGALRFPGGTIHIGGGGSAGGCVQLVANKISFTGNGNINFGHQCAGAGTTTANAGADATVKVFE